MNNHSTVYIGMDVHKESFSLCCFALGETDPGHIQTIPSEHILVVKYVNRLRKLYGEEAEFICGYEAGCLGYTLYHQLKDCGLECVTQTSHTKKVWKALRNKVENTKE